MEPVTRLLEPEKSAPEPKDSSGKQTTEARPGNEPRNEEHSPNVDLKVIGKASLKCAWVLALSALLVHLAVSYLTAHIPITASGLKPRASILYFMQVGLAGLVIVFIFTPFGRPRMNGRRWDKIARETFHQFLKGWSAIWVSWFLLYLYFGIFLGVVKEPKPQQNVILQVTLDFLNIANSAAFFYVFLVLDMPSVSTEDRPLRNTEFRKAFTAVAVICTIIFLISAFCRFTDKWYGPYLSGLLVGISMAYFFGRLDSHHMNVNRWTLAPLYLYSIIQVSGPDLIDFRGGIKEDWQELFFAAALLLKFWLFTVVNYWLQNGSFARYFNAATSYIEGMRSQEGASGA